MPSDSEIRQLLCDDSLSDWFRMALLSALECNPEQAAHDASLLSLVLDRRAQSIAAKQIAGKAIAHVRGVAGPSVKFSRNRPQGREVHSDIPNRPNLIFFYVQISPEPKVQTILEFTFNLKPEPTDQNSVSRNESV